MKKKEERVLRKNASDHLIEKKLGGYGDLGKGDPKMKRKEASKKAHLKVNTDDTFSKYPNAFGLEAASQSVRSKHQDAKMNVESNKKALEDNARSRGIDQKNYKRRKK